MKDNKRGFFKFFQSSKITAAGEVKDMRTFYLQIEESIQLLLYMDIKLKIIFYSSIFASMLSYCSNTKNYIDKNKFNDCYEETAKGIECFPTREAVNYKKLKEEYPRVPSSNSSLRPWHKR